MGAWLAGSFVKGLVAGIWGAVALAIQLLVSPPQTQHSARSPAPPSPTLPPAAGLNLLHELLVMFMGSPAATQFHQAFYTQLVQEIFAVMTGGC